MKTCRKKGLPGAKKSGIFLPFLADRNSRKLATGRPWSQAGAIPSASDQRSVVGRVKSCLDRVGEVA